MSGERHLLRPSSHRSPCPAGPIEPRSCRREPSIRWIAEQRAWTSAEIGIGFKASATNSIVHPRVACTNGALQLGKRNSYILALYNMAYALFACFDSPEENIPTYETRPV